MLDLNGNAARVELGKVAKAKPETSVDVTATDADGGTVRAEVASENQYYSASAWYQWAKDKGRGYGAKIGVKF